MGGKVKEQEINDNFSEFRPIELSNNKMLDDKDVSRQNFFKWDKEFETEISNLNTTELDNTDKLFDLMLKYAIIQKRSNKEE